MIRKLPEYLRRRDQMKNSSHLRSLRDIKTVGTTPAYANVAERESLESALDRGAWNQEVSREKSRFFQQDAVVEKFQESYHKVQEELAARINKNRALVALRHELQQKRREGEINPTKSSILWGAPGSLPNRRFGRVVLTPQKENNPETNPSLHPGGGVTGIELRY